MPRSPNTKNTVPCTRISGPLLDRIDIHMTVPGVDFQKTENQPLTGTRLDEPYEVIRVRVKAARAFQPQRFAGLKSAGNLDILCNADIGREYSIRPAEGRKFCKLDDASSSLLKSAMSQH